MNNLNTPIALIIYNRPSLTKKVFEQVAIARPKRLLLIADGPKSNEDKILCTASRAVIDVNWPCKVSYNYSDINLGCRQRVSSGLDWVFDNVESSIILEDDCVPNRSFFRFCQDLLNKYKYDPRISMISGNNTLPKDFPISDSYYFSRFALIWGWATWRRSWEKYDVNVLEWPTIRDSSLLLDIHKNKDVSEAWRKRIDKVFHGHDTWDHQWSLACWKNDGIIIHPSSNLVTNIGFGCDATHTKHVEDAKYLSMPTKELKFPLRHPKYISVNRDADLFTFNNLFSESPWKIAIN